jgi:hypothetical protein
MSIDLQSIVSAWIDKHGVDESIELLNEKLGKKYSPASVNNWKNGNANAPLPVLQYIIDGSKVEMSITDDPFDGAKIYIATATHRDISPWTAKAIEVMRYRYKTLGYLQEVGSSIHLVRNRLAEKFVKTNADWMLSLDDDMAPPIGFPAESAKWGAKFDQSFNRTDVIERLMSHGKTFVSALYFDRGGQGIPMFAEGRNSPQIAADVRRGPVDKIQPTDWFGAGCSLIHRSVFTDMLEKIPDIRTPEGRPNGWYNPLGDAGEDVSFAIRAKEIGHQPFIDLGCICGHVGPIVHFNEKIR